MEYYHLSELRDCAGGYKQLITYVDDFAKNNPEHYRIAKPIKRAHEAMNNIDLAEIHKVLEEINPNQSRIISNLENIIAVVNDLRHTIGKNLGRFIDVDPKASEFFRFLSSLIPILNNELKKLYERQLYEPTDDDEKIVKNIDMYISGGYGEISVEDFIKDYLIYDISGNALIRRLNFLISICKYKPLVSSLKKYLLDAKKQHQLMSSSVNIVKDTTSIPKRPTTAKSSSIAPKSIMDFILLDDEQKQKLLKKLHTLIDGKKGKHVAFVLRSCVEHGLMSKPKFPILVQTFGYIGNVSGYRKYYNLKQLTEEEKREIKGIETHILTFKDSI